MPMDVDWQASALKADDTVPKQICARREGPLERLEGPPAGVSANPFSLDVDGDTIWVGSVPENRLTKLTDHGG